MELYGKLKVWELNMIYKGNTKIKDMGTYGVYLGSRAINAIYNGSRKVYQYLPNPTTFSPSSGFQTYIVPQGCEKLAIDAAASRGQNRGGTGGKGGRVQCTLSVTSGQTLYIFVGDIPTGGNTAQYTACDIRTNNAGITDTTSLNSRLIVAGAGGNGGQNNGDSGGGNGGAGGGLTGGNGGGRGGTQSAGGSAGGGSNASNGQLGLGGFGGSANASGGAGGAGYYGGGGGGAGSSYFVIPGYGGGGGSSYTDSSLCTDVVHTQGYRDGAGYITITPTK